MEIFHLQPPPVSARFFVAFAEMMLLNAFIRIDRKRGYWWWAVGAALYAAMGFWHPPIMDFAGVPILTLAILLLIDLAVDAKLQLINKLVLAGIYIVFMVALANSALRTDRRSDTVFRITEGSFVRQVDGKTTEIGRGKTRIVQVNLAGGDRWYVKDGVANIRLDDRTYVDGQGRRLTVEQFVRKLEAWAGKKREIVSRGASRS